MLLPSSLFIHFFSSFPFSSVSSTHTIRWKNINEELENEVLVAVQLSTFPQTQVTQLLLDPISSFVQQKFVENLP